MIPSGAAHNDMILPDENIEDDDMGYEVSEEGKTMV
jgi:hypothetical protein